MFNPITAAFGLAVLSTAACTGKDQPADAPPSPANAVASTTVLTTVPGPTNTAPLSTTAVPDVAIADWIDIKDCTFDARAQFFTGLGRLEARVDREISRLSARRAAMKSTANTQDWDFAMKEMQNARSSLKSLGEELMKATPETWAQEKEKVGQAWVRTQAAFNGVKSSTTS